MKSVFDLIIIGSGPAGLSASIYASRYKLDHIIFGAELGGQMGEIYEIENYPGLFSLNGRELIAKFLDHIEHFGQKIMQESVVSIEKKDDGVFSVKTSRAAYSSRALILAMGAVYRKMNIPGEREFLGKGVSYCATCDAAFFKDKVVSVIGGGNSAAVVALELSDFAKKVYLIHKDEKLLADPFWIDKINERNKIEIIRNNEVLEIKGKEGKVERVILKNPIDDRTYLEIDGVFIEVGTEPGVELAVKMGIKTDKGNYIVTDQEQGTNVPGVFAAGDITTGSNKFRQVVTACAEGALAANGVYKLLKLK